MGFGEGVIEGYKLFTASLPPLWQNFLELFLLVILIVIYVIFIWKFYRWISAKNLLELNLNKYNLSKNPVLTKMLAGGFYLLEYIVILPFIIFFWFTIFTLFLIVLTSELPVNALLIVSATIIAAIRMTAYYKEDLSRDLAKLLPFTLLAVSLVSSDFFNVPRIISQIIQIPSHFSSILSYLLFIVFLEIVLRLFDFVLSIFNLHEDDLKKVEDIPAN